MNLEAIKQQKATLPETYQQAKKSLATCSSIDECKSWADKAAALASYAKQADDDELENYAKRIRIRALKQCGVLLRAIEASHGANQNIRDGSDPKVTRKSAAADAGLSERQQKTAQRIASIPEDQFEWQVESGSPPTITELAEQGKNKKVFTKGQVDQSIVRVKMNFLLEELGAVNILSYKNELSQLDDYYADELDAHISMLQEISQCIRLKI